MLEEFDDSVASVHLGIAAGIFDTAFLEDVGEGENRAEFRVVFDFDDAAHNVAFEHDVHESVADAGRVQKSDFVFQKLFSDASDFHERRFSVEVNDGSIVAVDDFVVEMSGQNGGDVFGVVAVSVFESGIDIARVDFDNGTDELFETVKNVVAQVGSQSVGVALAGQSAIEDGERNALAARVEIGDTDTEDGIVEFVERIVVVEAVGVGDFVNGEKVTELLVIPLFDDSATSAGDDHGVILFLIEVVEDFCDFEIGNGAFLDWGDLYIFHKKSAPLVISG